VAASFESTYLGDYQLKLIPVEHRQAPNGDVEKVPETGLTIRFEGGRRLIDNSKVLKTVMESSAYVNGDVRIDPEDPTGFWRKAGILKTEKREVVVRGELGPAPKFEDLKKLDNIKLGEAPVETVVVTQG